MPLRSEDKMLDEDNVTNHVYSLYASVGNWFGFLSVINFFLICIVGGGVQTGSSRHVGHLLAYCTCPR
jgi:hypothetical protein